MSRQARIDYPGAFHHVIGRGIEHKDIFKEEADKRSFLKRIKNQLDMSSMQCYAWCIMDNHFHLLLQTGGTRLAEFMSRILTGYAVYYNKVHKRSGYLFRNRYKSIVCDKDEYMLSLIRYIHLNPVKAKVIVLEELCEYLWTGYNEIIEGKGNGVIDRKEVLSYFDNNEKQAVESYRKFISEGKDLKENYEGGGLIRSMGGLQELEKRSKDEKDMYDERILGGGSFVEEVFAQLDEKEKSRLSIKGVKDLVGRLARYYKVEEKQIIKSRTKCVREARQVFIYLGYEYLNKSLTELGQYIGIGQTAASKAFVLGRRLAEEKKLWEVI
ncbi:MAG: transposase, partial [Candidatus Omnitrophica bacterium]|nr:transposase [Candidatus Omnitrophota bacterium]